jgi:ribosomal protein S18 acetylase RimI-like enzyme
MIERYSDKNQDEVLSKVGENPLENFILIADLTQLLPWCDIRVSRTKGEVTGVFSVYRDLAFLAGAFTCQDEGELLSLVTDYGGELSGAEMVFICTSEQLSVLEKIAVSVEPIMEHQMVLESVDQLRCEEQSSTERLGREDIDDLKRLYRLCGTPAWTPRALDFGPFYGVRDTKGNIIAVAGVHFVSQFGSEIGNVATHPDHRRNGYAACCVAAVARDLLGKTPRVVLHFFHDNVPAQRLYEKMGFRYSDADPVYFVRAKLPVL